MAARLSADDFSNLLGEFLIDSESYSILEKGYGSRAVKLLIKRIKSSLNVKKLVTSHLNGEGNAGLFYQKLGFKYTGEILHGNDHVMELDLRKPN